MFAVEAYLTESFTSKPFATLSTYAFVAASWSPDGSVTLVILLESTLTAPEPFGLITKSIFVSVPADANVIPFPVAALVTSRKLTAEAVVLNTICSLPLLSAIKPPSANCGAVSVLLDNVSVPANVAKEPSDNAELNSAVVPVKVPSDKSSVIVLLSLLSVLFCKVSELSASIYDCKSDISASTTVIVLEAVSIV